MHIHTIHTHIILTALIGIYVFRNFEACVMGLRINWHKTKIQNIGTGDAPRTVHIDSQTVETVSNLCVNLG